MAEVLEKLRPDRDLQCYFERPSASAAMSGASATGFTISGTFRQQYDWAVLEWNRDNVFEHPAFRYLPTGDFSGLELTYDETRVNCMAMDSDVYATVEWPSLRVWHGDDIYPIEVPLRANATPIEGTPAPGSVTLELGGTATAGDWIGLTWLEEAYNHQVTAADLTMPDPLATAVSWLAGVINHPTVGSPTVTAAPSGRQITLTTKTTGANWNRVGVYGYSSDARTEVWAPWWGHFSGGASPTKWRVHLDFTGFTDIRKMRWTWAAELQSGPFQPIEFSVQVENWTVAGSNRAYQVAGPCSRRIEEPPEIELTGSWTREIWNYSGGTAHWTSEPGAGLRCEYTASAAHKLYLGARRLNIGGTVEVSVDGVPLPEAINTGVAGEDAMVRIPLGERTAGPHTVELEYTGTSEQRFYFDFLELAIPAEHPPDIPSNEKLNLATDWDTDHSICLAAERTAWMITSLGFRGRVNHYVGALWFYEVERVGHQYASATITFAGAPVWAAGNHTELTIGRIGVTPTTTLSRLHLVGETAETLAKAFEMEINRGMTAVSAHAEANVLTIRARGMGMDGEQIWVECISDSADPQPQGQRQLSGAVEGVWRTDLEATPRLNRAARDWHRAYFAALQAAGLDAVAALSMELRDVDGSVEAGMVQRCPAGDPVYLPTPAYQTNFSPASLAFWREAYRDLAALMAEGGLQPYLQFGEVQWWYRREQGFSGMPFYDQYTKDAFQAQYGRPIREIVEHTAPVSEYPEEAAFLPTLIGAFTDAVMTYVRQTYPACRFEVLYPLDVNETELNRAINYPSASWTPAALACLKTENFGFTYGRNLDKCQAAILMPQTKNFPPQQSAHLVGLSDATSPWEKEMWMSQAAGLESVVLFALDQYCLIGYQAPLPSGRGRSLFQG